MEQDAMTVPLEAGSSAGVGDMPIPEMNAQPQPGRPQSRPMTGTEPAVTGEMPIREMNAEPQQPGIAPGETAHEREKLEAYLLDRQGRQASRGSTGSGEMLARDMNASG
jgi:hypothetical protein